MSFRMIASSILALSFATASFAAPVKEQIHCPQLSSIQQTSDKLDAAEAYGGGFVAYTSQVAFEENNHPWYVGVANLMVDSSEEAIEAGQTLLSQASVRKNEIAFKQDEIYYCLYGKGDIVAITGNLGMKSKAMMFKK